MADPYKNLQAAARRRGLSLRKHKIDDDGSYAFRLYRDLADKRGLNGEFEDLTEVRDELRIRPVDRAYRHRRYNQMIERKVLDEAAARRVLRKHPYLRLTTG